MSFGRYKAGQKIRYVGKHKTTVIKRNIGRTGVVAGGQSEYNKEIIYIILDGDGGSKGVYQDNIAPLTFTIDNEGNLE